MANPTPPPASANETGHDPVAQTLALIQPWIDYVPPQQRRLGVFIFLALALHLVAFPFITIDTTRAELRHQLRPHVTVESPMAPSISGQSPADEFWDRLNDPRLYLLPQSVQPGAMQDDQASAVGFKLGTSELPPIASPEGFQFVHPVNPPLDQRVGETINPERQSFSYDENLPAISPKTTWLWDEALAPRQPMGLPDLPSPISDTDLKPTQMRISITPTGVVENVLVEQSCGKADFDQEAALAARKIRFRSTDQSGLLWGRLTVFWHYSAKPVEQVVPTPPSTP